MYLLHLEPFKNDLEECIIELNASKGGGDGMLKFSSEKCRILEFLILNLLQL